MSKIQITPSWRDVKPSGFYVYIHRRATDGSMFYVGKGSLRRAWDRSKKSRSALWINCALKNGVNVEICQDNLSEEDAFLLEMWLVAKFRSSGVEIYNLTDGGDGATGYIPSYANPVCCSNGMRFETTGRAANWLRENGILDADTRAVSNSARGLTKSAYGLAWWYDGSDPVEYIPPSKRRAMTNGKAVCCSNGMTFNSSVEAAKWMKENGVRRISRQSISNAANGKTESSGGFSWWFYGDNPKEYTHPSKGMIDRTSKPVLCSNGILFPSGREAARWLMENGWPKASDSRISSAASGARKTAYGFSWKHVKRIANGG